jgi:hypothetical protein
MLILSLCQSDVQQTGTEFQSPPHLLCPHALSPPQLVASAMLLEREIGEPLALLNG